MHLIICSLTYLIIVGNIEGKSPQPESSQPLDMPEQSKSETSMAMDFTGMEPEVAQVEEAAAASADIQKDDPLSRFLPPPVTTKCSEELQVILSSLLCCSLILCSRMNATIACQQRLDIVQMFLSIKRKNFFKMDMTIYCFM